MWTTLILLATFTLADAAEYTVYTTGVSLTVHGDARSWCYAAQGCIYQGRRIADLKTEQLDEAAASIVPSSWDVWIGGNDMYSEGTWVWGDGTKVSPGYTNWVPGEPNDNRGEDCMDFVHSSQKWNDEGCGREQGYICQLETTREYSAQYSVLTFSDLISGYNSRTSFWSAQKECESKGMRLALVDNEKDLAAMKERLASYPATNYWIASENGECATMSSEGIKVQDCANTALPFVCEVVTPWAVKLSDFTPQLHETENLELECTARGFPLPDVAWYKDDELITDKIDQRIHQSIGSATSTLVISNSQLDDAGQYRCYATNAAINHEKRVFGLAPVKVLPAGSKIEG